MSSHAEIEFVWPRDGHIRLTGRLHGHRGTDAGPWRLLLVLRDHDGQRLRYDARMDGTGFDAAVPVDDLALDGLAMAVWDVHLARGADGDEELLRVGRRLDDIPDKRKIFVFPAQSVTSDEDGTLVKPFYTKYSNLSVKCVPGDLELGPDDLPLDERAEWSGR